MKPKSATTGATLTSTRTVTTSGTAGVTVVSPAAPGKPLSQAKIESAVYSYIQAMRALGKTRITTAEIAEALGLPEAVVRNASESLTDKGVRAAE